MLLDSLAVALALLACCLVFQVAPAWLGWIVVALAAAGLAKLLAGRRAVDANKRLSAGLWWGYDAAVRHAMTPVALGGGVALTAWALLRASWDQKLGGYGSLLVLVVFVAVAAKLTAETYLYAQLGGEPSPRQTAARRLIGPLSTLTKLRYALGAIGGIVFPLAAQLLAGGSKNIPAVTDATPPAVVAALALACLVPGELLERRLFHQADRRDGAGTRDSVV